MELRRKCSLLLDTALSHIAGSLVGTARSFHAAQAISNHRSPQNFRDPTCTTQGRGEHCPWDHLLGKRACRKCLKTQCKQRGGPI